MQWTGPMLWCDGLPSESLLMRGRADYLTDRYSERSEKALNAINRQIEKPCGDCEQKGRPFCRPHQ